MPKPYIFDITCDLYQQDFIVAVGATKKDVLAYLKRTDAKKEWVDFVENSDKAFGLLEEKATAAFSWSGKANMFLLKPYKDTWEYWETLMHECTHATQWMGRSMRMESEDEALAYFHEWLFRSIRRKLQAQNPKPRRTKKQKTVKN